MGVEEQISNAIRDLVKEWDCTEDPSSINSGSCETFADEIVKRIGHGTISLWDWEAEKIYGGPVNEDFTWVHCFIAYRGRFYDNECWYGVDDWRDLPIFHRHLAHLAHIKRLNDGIAYRQTSEALKRRD